MDSADPSQLIAYLDFINTHTQQAFFVFDLQKRKITYLNGAFEQLWGRKLEEVKPGFDSVLTAIHPDDQQYVAQTLQAIGKGVEKKNVEFRVHLPDGREKWLCVSVCVYQQEGQRVVVGFVEDITKNKEYTFNLQKYNSKKDSTLEILSHDLASPMNTLLGLARLVAKRTEQYNDPMVAEALQVMQQTCQRGVELIRDFVAQEFLESSNVDLKKERVDLVQKIGIVMDNYQHSEQAIKKSFRLLTSGKPIYAAVDDTKFMQVINNLVSNAIKFTPDGGIISVQIEDQSDTAEASGPLDERSAGASGVGSVLITVEDDGIGIPEHLQAGLFEKFTKARRPGLKGEKSTGLGMSIIRTIVEWHGGRIWFESQENKGSKFFIQIPKE
jgi:two-component system sensor histidine kinase VicK